MVKKQTLSLHPLLEGTQSGIKRKRKGDL